MVVDLAQGTRRNMYGLVEEEEEEPTRAELEFSVKWVGVEEMESKPVFLTSVSLYTIPGEDECKLVNLSVSQAYHGSGLRLGEGAVLARLPVRLVGVGEGTQWLPAV